MEGYRQRIADDVLQKRLEAKGAVLIEGPKACGKTTTAEMKASSIIYINDPKQFQQNLMLSEMDPEVLLEGDNPRLIDEWQLAPKLWDAIRFSIDHRRKFGLYILTGSAVPANTNEIHHTGIGRFSWMKMRPMSLYESGESTGEVSLSSLFNNPKEAVRGTASLSLQDIEFLICRGGWPLSLDVSSEVALRQSVDYVEAIIEEDISRVDGVKKNTSLVRRLMRTLARNQGTQVTIESLVNDVSANETMENSRNTIASYLNALKKIFVIEDMEAWNPKLRSKSAVRTSDTRYFIDPSIATASLRLGPGDLVADLETMGFMFETLAVRDLRVYADAIDADVYHYRDKSNLECDAVIHCRNGKYGLVEIKLGGESLIDKGVESLLKLSKNIDFEKMSSPSFLMVLTAVGNRAYKRPDGVLVVPIGSLKN